MSSTPSSNSHNWLFWKANMAICSCVKASNDLILTCAFITTDPLFSSPCWPFSLHLLCQASDLQPYSRFPFLLLWGIFHVFLPLHKLTHLPFWPCVWCSPPSSCLDLDMLGSPTSPKPYLEWIPSPTIWLILFLEWEVMRINIAIFSPNVWTKRGQESKLSWKGKEISKLKHKCSLNIHRFTAFFDM